MSSSSAEPASASTLEALEYPAYLDLLAELAATDAGRERLLATRPCESRRELEERRRRFEEAAALLEEERLVPAFEEPLLELLADLTSPQAEVGGTALRGIAALVRAARSAARRILEAPTPCPALAPSAAELADLSAFVRRVERTLDRRGGVREDASPRLVALGGAVRRARDGVYRQLGAYAEKHREDLQEEVAPLRDGRVVLMLRAGAKARGRGLVHGGSGTGRSLYFEPLEAVEANNRLQQAQGEEEEERRRLLAELVSEARRAAPEIGRHLDLLAELDCLQAAHRFAALSGSRLAEISDRHDLAVVAARHPLLDPALADLRQRALGSAGHAGPVVPLELELHSGRRVLVVTGPNAGGKTVALKTVGLLAIAARSGLPFPAAAGTRVPFLSRIVATVGDEQNLLEDRSTFSARLMRLHEAWEAAGPDALVLLDELGSGTDPEEGSALAVALLEALAARGSVALVTTHLTQLAAAALEVEGAGCAAMRFDPATGSPTYELEPGTPAGSEALALARRMRLPPEWLDRAEALLGPGHRDLRMLLAEVESVRRQLGEELGEARRQGARLARELAAAEESRQRLDDERARVAKRSRQELESFRRRVAERLEAEVERLRQQVEAGRRRGLAPAAVERLFAEAPRPAVPEPASAGPLEVGALVEHRSHGWRGTVERLALKGAEVRVGGKKVRCRPRDLRRVAAGAAAPAPGGVRVPDPGDVPPELHLIGKRVEEALEELDGYLDRALLGARQEVRVVHGHGTGRLRRAVRDHLKTHPAVAGVRGGRPDEGGDGATVVALRV